MRFLAAILLLSNFGLAQKVLESRAENCNEAAWMDADRSPYVIWYEAYWANGECQRPGTRFFHWRDTDTVVEITEEEYAQSTCRTMISDDGTRIFPLKAWKHCLRNPYAGSGTVTSAGIVLLSAGTGGIVPVKNGSTGVATGMAMLLAIRSTDLPKGTPTK